MTFLTYFLPGGLMKPTTFSHFIQHSATVIAILMLAACSATPVTGIPPADTVSALPTSAPSATSAPALPTSAPSATVMASATGTPSPTPAATATSQSATSATSVPYSINSMPTQAPGTAFEGLSSGLDNAKQARIRTVLSVTGEPNVDVYVNGLPAFNGGVAQQGLFVNRFSGWLYVTPGTYSVTLVPHGGTLAQALFAPVNVKAEAGHRYTVAEVGQVVDKNVRPLVVDETALEAEVGAKTTNMTVVELNNIKGAPAIDELMNGKPGVVNIPYGGVKAGSCNDDAVDDLTIVTGHPEIILQDSNPLICEPGASFFYPANNDAPTGVGDGNASNGTSELNVVDFLAGFNGHNLNDSGHILKFDILLAAIDKAGLRDKLVNSAPYLLIAPTDEAFDALPKAQKDALLNDPQALLQLLNAHIVDGYFPSGSFSGSNGYGTADRTVINRSGQQLKFSGDLINDLPVGRNYIAGNGDRVLIIYSLLPVK
jgi:hypothetical protein